MADSMLDAHAQLAPLVAEDFEKLVALHKACRKEDERKIQTIMIEYFEKRPDIAYVLAQFLMAQCFGMEAP